MAYWGSSWLQSFVHRRAQGEVPAHSCEGRHFIQRDPGLPDLGGGLQLHQEGEELCLSANGPWDATVVDTDGESHTLYELAFDFVVSQQGLVVE